MCAIRRGAVLAAALFMLCASCHGANLLVNGGFESAGWDNYIPGWTNWRASWGSGEYRATITTTKVNGSRALLLTCASSSFGVYQEVTVTPGKAYQMNGWWKGHFPSGTTAWYDCELLDGPFDIVKADSRPPDLPYKVCTYDPATASWDWQRMSDAYYTTLSIFQEAGGKITKNGIRVATTNKMTVILRTGGLNDNHPYGYYDDVTLEQVPELSIAQAKALPDRLAVMLVGNVVSATFTGHFYIQSPDRVAGIRVMADPFPYSATVGQLCNVAGIMRTTSDGEPYVEASYFSFYGAGEIKPVAMSIRALSNTRTDPAPNTLGLTVRVCGKVIYMDSRNFMLDDGSGETVRCVAPTGVTVSPSWTFATVTGISACLRSGAQQKRILRVVTPSGITAN